VAAPGSEELYESGLAGLKDDIVEVGGREVDDG